MSAVLRRRALVTSLRRAPTPALLSVSLVGWILMVWLSVGTATTGSPHGVHAAGEAHAGHAAAIAQTLPVAGDEALAWAAMILAMSPLLLTREVSRLWLGSLRRRRASMLLCFASGYALVWAGVGIVLVPLAGVIGGNAGMIWIALAITAVWHCSPLRQRALNACHRARPLRVFGLEAHADAWRWGVTTGAACSAACAPVMLLVLTSGAYHLPAMAAATILLTVERYAPARRPRWRLPLTASREPELPGLTVLSGGRRVSA
jgi:predicted metal-binding membrane protein